MKGPTPGALMMWVDVFVVACVVVEWVLCVAGVLLSCVLRMPFCAMQYPRRPKARAGGGEWLF